MAWRVNIFLRYYVPVLLWAGVITLLSTSEFHAGFTYRLIGALMRWFVPDVSAATLRDINAVVRKLAHVTEYFLLAMLVWRALRRATAELWRRRWALGTLAAGVVFAGVDELHQLFEKGRGSSLRDVGFDSLGVLLALAVLYTRTRLGRAQGVVDDRGKADSSLRSE